MDPLALIALAFLFLLFQIIGLYLVCQAFWREHESLGALFSRTQEICIAQSNQLSQLAQHGAGQLAKLLNDDREPPPGSRGDDGELA